MSNQQTGDQLPIIKEDQPLSQQEQEQQINLQAAKSDPPPPPPPKLAETNLSTGPREDYLKIGVPLYQASIKCDWKAAKAIFDKYPEKKLVKCSITENGETSLHIAASAKNPKHVEKFVKNLVDVMARDDLEIQNETGNTALYIAAIAGHIKAVKLMVEKNEALLTIAGVNGQIMPLYAAVLFGKKAVVKYLYNKSNNLRAAGWTPLNRGWLLEKCIEMDMFDVALKIVKSYPGLCSGSALEVLARKPEVFRETRSGIISWTIKGVKNFYSNMCVSPQPSHNVDDVGSGNESTESFQESELFSESEIFRETDSNFIIRKIKSVSALVGLKGGSHEKEDCALQLLQIIWGVIAKKTKDDIDDIIRGPKDDETGTHPSRILFLAAEMGNTRFVVELIRQYPDLIWKLNDDGLSIFHVAAIHRREGIYNLLYEIGSMKDFLTPRKDGDDNNMLHLVAKRAKKNRLEDVSGVALQMQRELLWFKEVEAMIPPTYKEKKNKRGLKPFEVFTEEHESLMTLSEKWMKETASQCMVVAALIATIVFAAAFTVPGGYNQDNGIPIFHSKATFMVFVVADAISLFASSASILMFLSILTSRYAERDFLYSLPRKLMIGLATLFISIVTMTVAFSVSFFVLYHKGVLWMPILIAAFAVMPVLLYVLLQFGLFYDIFRSTHRSRYLFKPKKQIRYYKNPKV